MVLEIHMELCVTELEFLEKSKKNGPKTVFFEVFLMSLFLRAVANSGKLKVISMILDGCGQKWKWPFSS